MTLKERIVLLNIKLSPQRFGKSMGESLNSIDALETSVGCKIFYVCGHFGSFQSNR